MAQPDLERVAMAYACTQLAERQLREARRELRDAMRAARTVGASYAAIGKAAGGVSRQRVAEILGES